jgi:hypothetical protein
MLQKNSLFTFTVMLCLAFSLLITSSCKKSGIVSPSSSFPDSLALATSKYAPTTTDFANGVTLINKGGAIVQSKFTDYGYYITVNNGLKQKVSLGQIPQNNIFEILLHNLLPASNYIINGYVVYGGVTYYAPAMTFTTYWGTWKRLANFTTEPQNALSHGPVGFAVNGSGYAMFPNGHLYQYSPATDIWTTKNSFNLNYVNLQETPHILFTLNNTAYLYFRGGIWKYNVAADTWTNILQQSLAVTLAGAAFVVNNKAYIMQCVTYGFTITSLVYDPVANTLTGTSMASQQKEFTGFTTNANVYIVDSQVTENISTGMFPGYVYNPENNTYTMTDNGNDTGPFAARTGGVSFTVNGKGYIGEGNYGAFDGDYYAYDEAGGVRNVMTPLYTYNDSLNLGDRFNGLSFVINGTAYVGFGDYGRTDFWQFTP